MSEAEKVCFAQVDGHLDTNPKIRKAGSVFATAIFEFLLRRVAIAHTNGYVPIRYIDPEYLSDVLMMTCDDARHGTSRAVTANLIAIDEQEGRVYIVGWSAEWGRRPKDGAERTQSWRDREKRKRAESNTETQAERDETSSHVTDGDESDVLEEKRREEKEIPEAALAAADKLRAAVVKEMPNHRLAKDWPNATRRKWGVEFDRLNRIDGRSWTDISLVIHWLFYEQTGDARFVVQSPDALREKWDRIEAQRAKQKSKAEPTQRMWNEL